ncbi:MAG: hypothetical protein NT018_05845 [Armatimonadetes bacterium]|nr:hypothetical protein [Armatimonadota bacterium]
MKKTNQTNKIMMFSLAFAVLILISGCGGGSYPTLHATPDGIGENPPPIPTNNHWSCGFEANEGFSLGSIAGQVGWVISDWKTADNSSITITSDMAAAGTACMKMDCPTSSDRVEWWRNIISAIQTNTGVPDVPLKSVTFRMKVYRDPGVTVYPPDSNTQRSNLWFNQFSYAPENPRYIEFGDSSTDTKLHATMMNSTPRIWNDAGWEQIAGRFIEIVIYDNFNEGVRIVWYDGIRVATVPIYNSSKRYSTFGFGYQALNPIVPANLGKPVYIDDIDLSWEIAQ